VLVDMVVLACSTSTGRRWFRRRRVPAPVARSVRPSCRGRWPRRGHL